MNMDLREYSGIGNVRLHLSSVEKYVTASEDEYQAPPIPVDIPDFSELSTDSRENFGSGWLKYFYLSKELTFLNHGALGCTLKSSLLVSQAFERYMDSQPVRVKDRELVPLLSHVRREVAKFVGTEARDLFLIENCTAGISTILKSLLFTAEDKILTLSLGYGAVDFAVDEVCALTGANHYEVEISLPVSGPEQIVDMVKKGLCEGIKLAIIDHIPSNAAFILPLKELIDLCKQRDILVLVDGAHSLGQIDLNIQSYGADFYVTNCHKWFCNTRGSAIAYVRRELQPLITPLVVSWGYGRGFNAEFAWSGTQYYSAYVSLLSTLNFWKVVGGQAIREYCYTTVKQAARLCREAWNVKQTCPEEMMGTMALVVLPDKLNDPNWKPNGVKKDLIVDCLYFVHKIEIPIRNVNGTLYVRLSCHIYNQMSEFEKFCSAILEICENRDSLINYNSKFNMIPDSVPW